MSVSQSKTPPPTAQQAVRWSLEVIRGRVTGREYALKPGEIVLGNALNGAPGLDLVEQEGNSPRKMAARQAAVAASGADLTIRDLDSPGGTFVNQQRLLAGQARRLVGGDVIQLGSVQLRVKQTAVAPAVVPVAGPPKPSQAPASGTAQVTPSAASRSAPASATAPITKPAPAATAPVSRPVTPAPTPVAKPSAPAAPVTKPVTPVSPAPTVAGRLSAPFALAEGSQCRTWDDFLVLAAQNWPALRDELTSGRLAEFLRRIHRPELVPVAGSSRSADDQLDDWLARIPATVSSSPELDVHPETLQIRAASGGGVTQQMVRVTNVGYRLLRWSAQVDPPATVWLRLRPEHAGKPFQTIDHADLPIELQLPETIDRPLIAQIVIESNGGTRRVGVRVERPAEQIVMPGSANEAFAVPDLWRGHLNRFVSGVRPAARIAIGCLIAVALRGMAMLLNALPIGVAPAGWAEPRLASEGALLAAAGIIAGLALASRRGDWRDFPAAAVAGALLGLLAAAVWFAALRSVEPMLGSLGTSVWAIGFASALLGAMLALISLWAFPYRSNEPEVAP
jgi:FHA domain